MSKTNDARSPATRIADAMGATTRADEAALYNSAATCLRRNGMSTEKAIVPFVNRLRISPEIRALIGGMYVHEKAIAYLGARAAEMRGFVMGEEVQKTPDSQLPRGLHPTEASNGAQLDEDSQMAIGTAARTINVRKHTRNRPGEATRGRAELRAVAPIIAKAFSVQLSSGADFKKLTGREVRAIVPNTSFDFAMSVQAQRHTQFEDSAVVADFLSDDVLATHVTKARRFSSLVAGGVSITIDAFLAMDARMVEHVTAA